MCISEYLSKFIRSRLIKFGVVGFSGTIINLFILYLNQEYLFSKINPKFIRLYLSLGGAIFVATMSNFLWNRWWTWEDRKNKTRHGFFIQMIQYFLGSSIAIIIQYTLTILLAGTVHYLQANVLAIIIAAIFTYLINDMWTFAIHKKDIRDKQEDRKIVLG